MTAETLVEAIRGWCGRFPRSWDEPLAELAFRLFDSEFAQARSLLQKLEKAGPVPDWLADSLISGRVQTLRELAAALGVHIVSIDQSEARRPTSGADYREYDTGESDVNSDGGDFIDDDEDLAPPDIIVDGEECGFDDASLRRHAARPLPPIRPVEPVEPARPRSIYIPSIEPIHPLEPIPPPAAPEPLETLARPVREIFVTGHTLSGSKVTNFETGQVYRLSFGVDDRTAGNLASGRRDIAAIAATGLNTQWIVTSSNVEFIPALSSVAKVEKIGSTSIAQFDLFIPDEGKSATETLAITKTAETGLLTLSIYAISPRGSRELFRELTITLENAPAISKDEVCVAPGHLHLDTLHEWTTPAEHIQITIVNGAAIVTTQKPRLNRYDFYEPFSANDNSISTAIVNIRASLEGLRQAHSDYFDDMDADDLRNRLEYGNWKPYSNVYEGWTLPDEADPRHVEAFNTVQASPEWQALASDGYALFERCFPDQPGRDRIRKLLQQLPPGSRIDFHWTEQSGSGFVSHVPWALMYMEPVDVLGSTLPDPIKFLGLRFRIGNRSWPVTNASLAVGGLESTYSISMLYWGDKDGDQVAAEARWQAREFQGWDWIKLLPDASVPDRKRQVVSALAQPQPAPAGVLYFYCHCSVGDGAQPCLRFGNTSRPEDTLRRSELSRTALQDAPLVFANACTTAQADPHMTSELEQTFFSRGIRAFIGTETKVPIKLASKFAWLYFHFLYRRIVPEPGPMSAGESLTQARMFLWTQYRNVGGLFYSITNQYDLYLASHEEVLGLAEK